MRFLRRHKDGQAFRVGQALGLPSMDAELLVGDYRADKWLSATSLNDTISDLNDDILKHAKKLGIVDVTFSPPVITQGESIHDHIRDIDFLKSATWTQTATIAGQNFVIEGSAQNSEVTAADSMIMNPRGSLFSPSDSPAWKSTATMRRSQ